MSAFTGSLPPLTVQCPGTDRSLTAGPSYVVGRDPACDIVIPDARVSSRHLEIRSEDGVWVLEDTNSTNGTFAGDQRVNLAVISGERRFRLGHPVEGLVLICTVGSPGTGRPDLAAAPVDEGVTVAPPGGLNPPVAGASMPALDRSVVRPLPVTTLRIGRLPDNDVVIADPDVSRHHAELRNVAGAYHIVD